MLWTRNTAAVLAAASVAVALAACSGASGLQRPTSNPTQAATSSASTMTSSRTLTPATPTPAPTGPEEIATSRAEDAVRAYYRVSTECMKDPPAASATCFDGAAISSELVNLRNGLASARAAHTKVIGDATIDSMTSVKTSLTNKPKETPPTIPKVVFNVCYDVSKVNVVDYQGKSIVPPERKARAIAKVTVLNYKYPDPTQWRVGFVEPTGKSC